MDPTVLVAIISTIGAVLVGYFAYRGGRVKALADASAAKEAIDVQAKLAEADEDKTSIQGWQSLAAEYRADRQRVREELALLRRDLDETRGRVRELEQEREGYRQWKALAGDYIRVLLALLHANNVPTPPAPHALRLTDADTGSNG